MTVNLNERAAQLWPNKPAYQAQWIRSVQALRQGKGWILDGARVTWRYN